MTTTRSNWRLRSRAVIDRVLEQLPADADEHAVKLALRDAYPFGTREHHPYRMWCAEVRAALLRRFDVVTFDRTADPTGVKLTFWHERQAWWLAVSCGWCDGKIDGGCLQCVRQVNAVEALVSRPEWRAWRAAVRADFEARGPFADWLDEQGYDLVAHLVRMTVQVPCPVCKGKGYYTVKYERYGPYIPMEERRTDCGQCWRTGLVLQVEAI